MKSLEYRQTEFDLIFYIKFVALSLTYISVIFLHIVFQSTGVIFVIMG